MARKQAWIVRAIADPTKNFLAFFLVGTLLFTVVSDGVSYVFWDLLGTWLEGRWGIQQGWFRAIVTTVLLGVLLGVTYATNLAQWLRERLQWLPFFSAEELRTANVEEMQTRYPGLIVIMSPKTNPPAEVAILHHWDEEGEVHPLRHCWIICTDQSLPFAEEMVKRLVDKGITQNTELHYGTYNKMEDVESGEMITLLVPQDQVDDPNYIQRLVNAIYADAEKRGLDESEVVADYTGGMKGATAGMLLACARPERPLQYISQVKPGVVMAVMVSYELKPLGRKPGRRRRSPLPTPQHRLPPTRPDGLLPDPWLEASGEGSSESPRPVRPPADESPPDRPS